MDEAVLSGGPHDGRRLNAGAQAAAIQTVMLKPVPPVISEPKPSWWHPIRRLRWRRWRRRWRPPPPPEVVQITYRDTGRLDGGARVFEIAGGWEPFRGPELGEGDDLHGGLLTALDAVHPVIRQDRRTHWVMNLDWYKQVRAFAASPADEGSDQDEWEPGPDDRLFGMRISVTEDGGRPHLENPGYPSGWGQVGS